MATVKLAELKLVDEPPPRNKPGRKEGDRFKPLLDALADHPDKWALIGTKEYMSTISKLRNRYPDYEFTSRAEKDKPTASEPAYSIWACFRQPEYFLAKAAEKRAKETAGASGE